ncbi:Mpv17-like protein [Operophtera brumata]|uniref:Mpv17-like protein n=1 Tax=Operophtera brumata TaxID=104452 RepID=A0A0L7KX04_OPEBR|nr:Mpv17-like protein [Operophtera brumata]
MSGIFAKVKKLKLLKYPLNYPLVRGMVSYSIIWPTCSIVQEYLVHGTSIEDADFSRAARFGIFGTFFMAPVFYGWMKYTSRFFKSKTLKTAMIRAAIEQVSYSPLAMAYFFFGMSLLEAKPVKTCVNEVKEKFWPTYKIGAVFWPTAQTINFYYIGEKNRILFVSAASFVWTVYLAHMKAKEQKEPKKIENINGDFTSPGLMNTSADVTISTSALNTSHEELDKTNGLMDASSNEDVDPSNVVEIVEVPEKQELPMKDDEEWLMVYSSASIT